MTSGRVEDCLLSALFPGGVPDDADAVRITENDRGIARDGGLLRAATRVGEYRIAAHDDEAGQHGLIAQVWCGDDAAVCAVRVGLVDGRMAEVEIIRGPSRFPGSATVDARDLRLARRVFAQPVAQAAGREALIASARGYYDAVNQERPELAPLERSGARVEAGTQITGNPLFRFDFYAAVDGGDLPNFGAWTAQEQFARGLWNADRVPDVRVPIVDRTTGVVFAFMTYCPWAKRDWTDVEGVGGVTLRERGPRRVALNAVEAFKIENGQILEMESVWSIEAGDYRNSWAARTAAPTQVTQ